jgi:hypothetical protein
VPDVARVSTERTKDTAALSIRADEIGAARAKPPALALARADQRFVRSVEKNARFCFEEQETFCVFGSLQADCPWLRQAQPL